MKRSREGQENASEAQEAESRRAEAFDKWLCSNPGHTSRDRAIVANMTPDERYRFQRLSMLGGGVMGLTIAGAMSIVMLLPNYVDIGSVGRIVSFVAYLPIAIFVVLCVRRSAQKFMRSTAWYKAQGWEQGTGNT